MKILILLFSVASIYAFLSCQGKKSKQGRKPDTLGVTEDTISKKVSQIIFNEVVKFDYSDFGDLKNNKSYDRFLAGQIILTTGQVVCTDPLYGQLALPQSWTVNKGQYPVYLYIALGGDFISRVAYAEMVIKDEVPEYWKMSLISEGLLTDSFEKKMNGMYPVEAGLSCFADFETFKIYEQETEDFYKLQKEGNYYDDVLEKYFKENHNIPKSSRGEDWINYKPKKSNGNIIIFGSGYGDGFYPRYVGYDKGGNIVKFITDFIQLNDATER